MVNVDTVVTSPLRAVLDGPVYATLLCKHVIYIPPFVLQPLLLSIVAALGLDCEITSLHAIYVHGPPHSFSLFTNVHTNTRMYIHAHTHIHTYTQCIHAQHTHTTHIHIPPPHTHTTHIHIPPPTHTHTHRLLSSHISGLDLSSVEVEGSDKTSDANGTTAALPLDAQHRGVFPLVHEPYTCERLAQVRGGYLALTGVHKILEFDFSDPEVSSLYCGP